MSCEHIKLDGMVSDIQASQMTLGAHCFSVDSVWPVYNEELSMYGAVAQKNYDGSFFAIW